MAKQVVIGRRTFLRLAALVGGAGGLASCTQAAPPAPTRAPEPTKASAPVAAAPSAPASPQGTTAPTAAPAKAPEPSGAASPQVAKPPAAATAVPPASSKAPVATATPETKIGKSLIGKLEGPEIITDPTKSPKTFKEAPMLAELVKAGKLPPVQQRLPAEPLVVKPVHEIGKYGGQWRRGFTGPADGLNGVRAAGGLDTILYMSYNGQKVMPNIARGWEVVDGGRTTVIYLRRGMKWSDGQPLTADDFMFWFEDMYLNKDLNPTPTAWMSINGKPGVLEKVDTYTIRFKFPDPYHIFPEVLSFATEVTHPAWYGRQAMGGYAPAHYLKQFHPKYADKDDLERKVKEGKYDNWASLLKFKNSWHLNPELPVASPWKTIAPANTPSWVLERNPYSIWVDTEGNQLPYIDRVVLTLAENLEVLNLRAIAGEYDMQARHIDIGKIPVYLENQQKGGYKLSIHPMENGSDFGLWFNLGYEADPELARWFNNTDFRRALSLGVEREQINETFFLGIGVPGSAAPAEINKYSPGPEYRTLWATYEPKKANEMLDKIGLDKKDAEGYRLRAAGRGRIRIELMTYGGQFVQYTAIGEMIKEHWKKIGIDLIVQEIERGLGERRIAANEIQTRAWSNDGTDTPYTSPSHLFPMATTHPMTLFGKWFASNGAQGKEPPPRMRQLMGFWRQAFGVPEEERVRLGKEIWKIQLDEVWYIGVAGQCGAVEGIQVTKTNMGNVPSRFANLNYTWPPSNSRPATFYWKN